MNKKNYNHQTMTAYLLGSLPESEAELFDELSFTDDEFGDDLKVTEKDLVDAYVCGELKGDQLERFKSYYLASPVRRGKVEFAQAFQSFAEKELANDSFVVAPKPRESFWAQLLTIPRLSLQWGLAFATLALIFFGSWLFWENSRLRSEIVQTQSSHDQLLARESELAEREKQLLSEISNQRTINSQSETELTQIREEREKLQQELKNERIQKEQILAEKQRITDQRNNSQISSPGQTNIAFILTPQLRGNNQLPTLSVSPKINLIEMQLELESDEYSTYRVALISLTNDHTLWRSGKIKAKPAGSNKALFLSFPAKLLNSQIYSLRVSGVEANGSPEIISDYTFKVVR
jgi:hypothetical protein